MSLYFSIKDEPKDIRSIGIEGLETHFIGKEEFLNKFNTTVPMELVKRLLQNLWAKDFGDLSVYILSANSPTPNHEFDKLMNRLCNNNMTFRVGSQGSMIRLGSYGNYPYVAFYKNLNQIDPDFIAFNKNFLPKDIKDLA